MPLPLRFSQRRLLRLHHRHNKPVSMCRSRTSDRRSAVSDLHLRSFLFGSGSFRTSLLSPGHPEGDVINGTSRLCQLFKVWTSDIHRSMPSNWRSIAVWPLSHQPFFWVSVWSSAPRRLRRWLWLRSRSLACCVECGVLDAITDSVSQASDRDAPGQPWSERLPGRLALLCEGSAAGRVVNALVLR